MAIVDVRLPPAFRDEGCGPRPSCAGRPGSPVLNLSEYVEQTYAAELLADGTGGVGYLLKDASPTCASSSRRCGAASGGMALDPERAPSPWPATRAARSRALSPASARCWR